MKNNLIKTAAIVAIYCTAWFGFSHAQESSIASDLIVTSGHITPVDKITFSPGITINTVTGEVTIPKNVAIPEAARAFWVAVAKAFPEVKKAMMEDGK